MGTSAKKRRKYIKKFDTILPFLRLMVYGADDKLISHCRAAAEQAVRSVATAEAM